MIIFVLICIILVNVQDNKNLTEQKLVIAVQDDLTFSENFAPTIYNKWGKLCKNFKEIVTEKEYTDLISITKDQNVLRLALLGKNGEFKYMATYNSPNVKIFPNSYKTKFFSEAKEEDGFLLLEGDVTSISLFLKSEVHFCSIGPTFELYYVKNDATVASRILLSRNPFKKTNKHRAAVTPILYKDTSLSIKAEDILNGYSWNNINVHVFDSDSNNKLGNIELSLHTEELPECNYKTKDGIFVGQTDPQGDCPFNNLLVKKYILFAHKKGYKSSCDTIEFVNNDELEHNVILVPEFTEPLKLVLTWNNPTIDLQLQSVFNYNSNVMCESSYFQKQCGAMQSSKTQSIDNTLAYQILTLTKIGNYNYLYYVQRLPKSTDLAAFELAQQGLAYANVDNSDMSSITASIKLYVKELGYSVGEFKLPQILNQDLNEVNLIWLGFCINGKIGDVSQKEIGKIWSRTDSAVKQFWNRPIGEGYNLPDSSICEELWKTTT